MSNSRDEKREAEKQNAVTKFANASPEAQARYLHALIYTAGFEKAEELQQDLRARVTANEKAFIFEPEHITERVKMKDAVRMIDTFKSRMIEAYIQSSPEEQVEIINERFNEFGHKDIELFASYAQKELKHESNKTIVAPDLEMIEKLKSATDLLKVMQDELKDKKPTLPEKARSAPGHMEGNVDNSGPKKGFGKN